jgi:peptidoglycan/xylan/chitin deacetylase (PgdA/CDA1 family)
MVWWAPLARLSPEPDAPMVPDIAPQPSASAAQPDRAQATLVLTFDNLGEAADLERGLWPPGHQTGQHGSVVEVLPKLLDVLAHHRLEATFFVEAINARMYPDSLRAIADAGHEIGHHGWRHETWDQLSAARESELLGRGVRAFAELGITVEGFRPPGGHLNDRSHALLAATGLRWCSPVGDTPRMRRGLAEVPFSWDDVDAYYLLPPFADVRQASGEPRRPLTSEDAGLRLFERVDELVERGGSRTLILHPFLALESETLAAQSALLAHAAALRDAGRLRVLSGRRAAAELRSSAMWPDVTSA